MLFCFLKHWFKKKILIIIDPIFLWQRKYSITWIIASFIPIERYKIFPWVLSIVEFCKKRKINSFDIRQKVMKLTICGGWFFCNLSLQLLSCWLGLHWVTAGIFKAETWTFWWGSSLIHPVLPILAFFWNPVWIFSNFKSFALSYTSVCYQRFFLMQKFWVFFLIFICVIVLNIWKVQIKILLIIFLT